MLQLLQELLTLIIHLHKLQLPLSIYPMKGEKCQNYSSITVNPSSKYKLDVLEILKLHAQVMQVMAHQRKQCPSCGKELARATYSRHVHDHTGSVCSSWRVQVTTNLQKPPTPDSNEEDSSENLSPISENMSFDFGSTAASQACCGSCRSMCVNIIDSSSEASNDAQDLESSEEMWEGSGDNSIACENQTAMNILFGVSLFLNSFSTHLFDMGTGYVDSLSIFKGTILFSNLLAGKLYPLNICSGDTEICIRKVIAKNKDCITEYAVCPACDHLYEPEHVRLTNGLNDGNTPNLHQCQVIKDPENN